MLRLFKRESISAEDQKLLDEVKARIKKEADLVERERRLNYVLVNDPLDFDALVRIGKKANATKLEIINASGAIIRYSFKDDAIEQTTVEADKATQEGYW